MEYTNNKRLHEISSHDSREYQYNEQINIWNGHVQVLSIKCQQILKMIHNRIHIQALQKI